MLLCYPITVVVYPVVKHSYIQSFLFHRDLQQCFLFNNCNTNEGNTYATDTENYGHQSETVIGNHLAEF